MRKPLDLSNSIYQQKNAKFGLGMECGMMINNRPDSTTGIQKAVNLKQSIKRAEAVALGNIKEDMMGGSGLR